jgi:hypothetical protein
LGEAARTCMIRALPATATSRKIHPAVRSDDLLCCCAAVLLCCVMLRAEAEGSGGTFWVGGNLRTLIQSNRWGKTVVRQSRAAMATAMLMTFLTLAACESGQGSGAGTASDESKAAGVEDKPMGKADLERVAVTDADLDGYEVERILARPAASRRTADPAECAPVVQALGGSSGFTATARVGRMISSKDHGPGASVILASHGAGDAARVIDALRTAAKRCGTFKDIGVGFRYDEAVLQPGPGYGDESVSLRLTQLAAESEDDEPVRVPCAVVAVRQGATVAMFYALHRPRGPEDRDQAAIPDEIIRAQLDKLGKPAAS